MSEFDIPIRLTFKNHHDAHEFIVALDQVLEKVIWQQHILEDNSVVVEILNITGTVESDEQEDIFNKEEN